LALEAIQIGRSTGFKIKKLGSVISIDISCDDDYAAAVLYQSMVEAFRAGNRVALSPARDEESDGRDVSL
jgi:hypothetical protein